MKEVIQTAVLATIILGGIYFVNQLLNYYGP